MKPQRKLSRYAIACTLCMLAACRDTPATAPAVAPAEDAAATTTVATTIGYTIVNEYPHDAGAFTEGLEFKDGFLYESTGQYGSSDVRRTELKTGKVLASTAMQQRYFGEGLTIIGGKLYQLTYREGKGFIYDLATLKQTGTFPLKTQEGWGMTSVGGSLVYDDGGNVLHFIDPGTNAETRALAVTDEQGPVNEINELELINGYIYANQWKRDVILKIDTATGRVVARADLGNIRGQAGISQLAGNRFPPDVLNGIAYDAATNRIFITGKYWPKVFEIRLDN